MIMRGILTESVATLDFKFYAKHTEVFVKSTFTSGRETMAHCIIPGNENPIANISMRFIKTVGEFKGNINDLLDYEENNEYNKKRYEVAKGVLHDILTHKDVLDMIMGWTKDGPDGDAPKESDIARISVNIANAFISKINE